MLTRSWGADARTVRTWDGIMFFWVCFWLVVGAWTGYQIWQLTGLSASTVDSGRALQSAGQALQHLGDAPVIGDETGQLGDRLVNTAQGIVVSGQQADRSIRGLSVLIGLAVGLAPTGPVLLFYLPLRVGRRRDVAQVRQALAAEHGQDQLQRQLAHRALSNLGYAQVRAVTHDRSGEPLHTAAAQQALADAELARLGLSLPAR